ncbi:MAG: diacylglycerol kinase family protein [Candidatus Kuenenbacteria bacterium]
MFKIKNFFRSFKYALHGFRFVWQEQNFRIQFALAFVVVLFMYLLGLSRLEKVALVIVITAVLILESLNTIFEHLADILKPRLHNYILIIKDIMASIVLLASISALIVGLMIFWPYLF